MKIFLSHISSEERLAAVLKEWIETSFIGQFEIFVSSDINDVHLGSKWLETLERALSEASALIVLCSPHSAERPWVNFETGGAWVKQIPIIPICHSGQKKGTMPMPLSLFQGLEVDSPTFVADLLHTLSKQLGLKKPPPIDKRQMLEDIQGAVNEIARQVQTAQPATSARKRGGRQPGTLPRKTARLLRKIAKSHAESCTCEKLAESLNMDPDDVDVHLRYLMDRQFIIRKTKKGRAGWYVTTEQGRDYLVQHELL